MKHKEKRGWNRPLALILMLALMVTALPMLNRAEAVDLTNCSVTAEIGFDDLSPETVQIDLYRIAKAVPMEGFDAYEFQAEEDYAKLDLEMEDQEALAQQAAEIALTSGKVTKSGAANEKIAELDGGLYLIIVHDADVTDAEDYRITLENGNLATFVNAPAHEYDFLPQLISLPSKEDPETGENNTANPIPWQKDLTVTLKATQSDRFGSLEIVKTLLSYDTSDTGTFVFRVVAVKEGKEVYRDVVAMNFREAGIQSRTIDHLPVGAVVTVTEVYSGSSYELVASDNAPRTITAEEVAKVSFTNDYDGPGHGHGINNHFEYGTYTYTGPDGKPAQNVGWAPPVATMD